MKDMDEALKWLNWEEDSKLTDNTRFWINRFNIPTLENLERDEIIQALERLVRGNLDPIEQAEVLTYSGNFHYFLSRFDEAESSLTKANKLYEYLDDLHRHAVTTWMLYLVQRAQHQFHRAFDNGRLARLHFLQKGNQYRQLGDPAAESWYQTRAHDLTAYLSDTPEDMYEWLFEFRGSRLNPTAAQLRDQLREMIERREIDHIKHSEEVLLEITRLSIDCEETAEAFAFCGVVEWLMNRPMNSLYYFRAALTQYLPASHEYAILTWMLGLVQFSISSMQAKAIVTLETAINSFDRLREHTMIGNDTNQRDWYAVHHIAMRRVLRTKNTV